MSSENISVVRLGEVGCDEEIKENKKKDDTFNVKDMIKTLCKSVSGTISFCLFFAFFWTSIPRTNSIIYQSHWLEVLLPSITVYILSAGSDLLNLITWTKEDGLLSLPMFLRMVLMYMIPASIFYVLSYAIWSVYLQFNHPMPNLGLTMWPTLIAFAIELWLMLPSQLLAKTEFRQKLKIYMAYKLWIQILAIEKEILAYLFATSPPEFQFLVPFIVAGCREIDKRIRSRLITKMVGEQDEPTSLLLAINVSSSFSQFIAIRLVKAELTTICSTLAIDFLLHLKTTYEIIKELTIVRTEMINDIDIQNNLSIKTLIIGELIEGFTPIVYGACTAMAYYGPNAHIMSNIGNNYWSEEIKNLGPILITMILLFAVDTLSMVLNSLAIWNAAKVNMLIEFCRVLSKYWFFIAIKLALNMTAYFATNDINMGMDGTQSFEWTSRKGWINLVNNSKELTDEEKNNLFETTRLN